MSAIHQIFLMVRDLDRARTFYEDGLGLPPRDEGKTSVSFETADCELKLQADFAPEVLAEFNLPVPSDRNRGAGAVFVLTAEEALDDVYCRVTAVTGEASGEPLTEPAEVPWGNRMFLVRDPDDYVWEVRAPSDG